MCVSFIGFRPVSYTHLDVYKRQKKDKAVLFVFALKEPAAELLQKVLPDSQKTYGQSCTTLGSKRGDSVPGRVFKSLQ